MQLNAGRIKFSVILVTYRRCDYLKACLREIFAQLKMRNDWEILLVVNGEDRETVSLLKEMYPHIRSFQIPAVSPAQARNILIKKAMGEYLCFLDDDSMPGENYFNIALEFISDNPKVDVFGGPETVFPDASSFEETVGMALLSPMATATTRLRHAKKNRCLAVKGNEAKLILCNLWCKRDVFASEGVLFDKRFFRNEENILLWQLQRSGKSIKYIPFFYVFHRKKKNLRAFVSAIIMSGRSRLKGFFLYPKSLDLVYFIPMIFVFYVAGLPLMQEPILWVPLVAYAILLVFFTTRITLQKKRSAFFLQVLVMQIVINVSYGLAFWVELFSQFYRSLHKQSLRFYKKWKNLTDSI